MSAPVKNLRLRYPNADRFARDYPLIREGRVFVPGANAAAGSAVTIELHVPGLSQPYTLVGRVAMVMDGETAKAQHRPAGMWVDVSEKAAAVLAQLALALEENEEYRQKLNLPPETVPPPAVKIKQPAAHPPPPPPPPPAAPAPPSPQAKSPPRAAPPAPPPPPAAAPASPAPQAKPLHRAPAPPPAADSLPSSPPPPSPSSLTSAPSAPASPPPPDSPPPAAAPSSVSAAEIVEKEHQPSSREEAIPLEADEGEGAGREFVPEEEEEEEEGEQESMAEREEVEEEVIEEEVIAPGRVEEAERAEKSETTGGVDIEKVREMITAGEKDTEEEEVAEQAIKEPTTRSDLSPKERERLQPVGEFIMDMVKAMSRSGYYHSDHPESRQAKEGLYEKFRKALADANEIMIIHRQTREYSDLLVSGILEDQVSVRTVVGSGMAELFIPKLKDYFERKGLVSFALKQSLTPEGFNAFIDIMSDPRADRGTTEEVGAVLTKALAEQGVTDVSTVFVNDVIVLEERVSWRVQLAINRLAKDIKMLPMFKGLSEREIHRIKVRIVEDIIRPLRHPTLLKEIIMNCYVIAKNVKDLDEEELEQTVIDSFPFSMLLPTSQLIFQDLHKIREQKKEHPHNPAIQRRLRGAIRIIKAIALRVIRDEAPGAKEFLEQLYFNDILAFHELPPQVQYRVNTIRLARDVKERFAEYAESIRTAATPDDAQVLLQCFQRILPILIEQNDWDAILAISRALHQAREENPVFRSAPEEMRDPLGCFFSEILPQLPQVYERLEKDHLAALEEILLLFGEAGIEVLITVLAQSESRSARKAAVDLLVKIGNPVLDRVRRILDDPRHSWYLQRNALLILGMIGGGEEDIKRTRRFLRHSHPRLREESLSSLARLEGKDAETAFTAALKDPDRRVMRRALASIAQLPSPADATIQSMLSLIRQEPPDDRAGAQEHSTRLALLIRTLGTLPEPPLLSQIEKALIQLGENRWKAKSSWLKKIRQRMESEEEPVVLLAIVEALGRIGSADSLKFLETVAREDSPLGQKAKEAVNRIKIRTES